MQLKDSEHPDVLHNHLFTTSYIKMVAVETSLVWLEEALLITLFKGSTHTPFINP